MELPAVLRLLLPLPTASDNKYSRGTVGFVTGSDQYPGAAILGIQAAQQAGVGIIRYQGPTRVSDLVLVNHPEVIVSHDINLTARAQAWVLGSGIDSRDHTRTADLRATFREPLVAVVDAGAISALNFDELTDSSLLLTPHQGEAMGLLNRYAGNVRWLPERFDDQEYRKQAALTLAELTGQTVLLKGSITLVADSGGQLLEVGPNSPYLATAGTGDVLAGLLGGIAAQNSELAKGSWMQIAHLGVALHSRAAAIASASSTPTASSVASALYQAINELLRS
jgi:ADP-dependent NAD(P)H-hydrate dehydratase / NAD(P)H-hydrate epimerase